MRRLACILSITIMCGVACPDIGPVPGTLQIEAAFGRSDLVCSCYVEALTSEDTPIEINERPAVHRRVAAVVTIKDVFKSRGVAGSVVTIEYEEDDQMGLRVRGSEIGLFKGETALLFLTATRTGYFGFADPFLGATPFHSIAQVGGAGGLGKLQEALAGTLMSGNREDVIRALQLLQGLDSFEQATLSAVAALCDSEVPEVAIPALGVLLKTKTPESVEQLKRYLDKYKGNVQPLALISVGSELGRIDSVKALPLVEGLATSRFVAVRYGAMDAIRRIKSPKSVPFLVARLDDTDATIQYVALITLAEVLGKYDDNFAPSMYLFDKKPLYYVGLWKRWWAEE